MNMNKNLLNIAIYARKSVALIKGDTLKTQEDECKRAVELRYGLSNKLVYHEYTDEKSGKNLEREAIQRLLRDIDSGRIDVICSYKLDRLGRSAVDILKVIDVLKAHNVTLICPKDNLYYNPTDESNVMGRLFIMLLSMFAELERENIRTRVADAVDALSRKGFWLGGTAPYGYKSVRVPNTGIVDADAKELSVLTVDEEQAKVIRFIYKYYNDNVVSFGAVAEVCDEMGYKPLNAGRFDQRTIQGMLENISYVKATPEVYDHLIECGYRADNISPRSEFDGKHGILPFNKTSREEDPETKKEKTVKKDISEWVVAVAPHEGIIDANLWIEVQKKIASRRSQKTKTNTKHNNALLGGGIFRCKACGEVMSYFNRKSKADPNVQYPNYRCEGKRKRKGKVCNVDNINATRLDNDIVDILFDFYNQYASSIDSVSEFLQSGKTTLVEDVKIPRLEKENDKLRKDIEGYIQSLSKLSEVTPEMQSVIMNGVQNEIAKAQKKICDNEELIRLERAELAKKKSVRKNLDSLAKRLANLTRQDFDALDMNVKKSIIQEVIQEVTWDGQTVEVNFKIPNIIGGDTDYIFSETALTYGEDLKPHF